MCWKRRSSSSADFNLALDEQNQLVDPITNLPVDITDPGFGLRDGSLYGQPVSVVAGRQLRAKNRDAGGFPRGARIRIRPNERYISARLGWTRRLSPYTNLFAGVGWRRTDIDGDATTTVHRHAVRHHRTQSDTYSGRVALTKTLAKDVFGEREQGLRAVQERGHAGPSRCAAARCVGGFGAGDQDGLDGAVGRVADGDRLGEGGSSRVRGCRPSPSMPGAA